MIVNIIQLLPCGAQGITLSVSIMPVLAARQHYGMQPMKYSLFGQYRDEAAIVLAGLSGKSSSMFTPVVSENYYC